MEDSWHDTAPLQLEGVHLSLKGPAGEVNILKGVSFQAAPGESVGVVGPSGSGKTSLLMLCAGLERATRGSVRLAGHDLGPLSEDALARLRRDHLGIVFQSFHLIATMTALENVALPLELSGRPDAFDRARDALAAVGLGPRLDHRPGQLSGGEQQRVALARAFVINPRVLLADEPTGNLDGDTGALIMSLLFDLHARSGTTLVLVTHDMALAQRCQRVVTLRDGQIQDDTRALAGAGA
ncbi:ABC transporter ATP-binding protein [Pararhodospirillum oryzae]|uniref:ABC transporter n=1 Tax=Pararhodospirillum oryzae TaxID=478448 RepID=A0A512H6A5_9PROT|nr:ATP-binding cassette domain-containing protein [Pararhodospirillum oryzae]GEO80920.1 ABC transporter [Pararhodospirillum oryzae]